MHDVQTIHATPELQKAVKAILVAQMASAISRRCTVPLHRSTFCHAISAEGFGERSLRALCAAAVLQSTLVSRTAH